MDEDNKLKYLLDERAKLKLELETITELNRLDSRKIVEGIRQILESSTKVCGNIWRAAYGDRNSN